MTTNRIKKELAEWNQELITPSKSLLCLRSFECEEKNAHIREETRKVMNERNNVSGVTFRYLQNKRGQTITTIEAVLAAALLMLTTVRWSARDFESIGYFNMLMSLTYSIFTLLPNVNNTINYYKTKKKCERWLEDKLEPEDLTQIKRMTYDSKENIAALNTLFAKRGFDTLPREIKGTVFPTDILTLVIALISPEFIPFAALSLISLHLVSMFETSLKPRVESLSQNHNQKQFAYS